MLAASAGSLIGGVGGLLSKFILDALQGQSTGMPNDTPAASSVISFSKKNEANDFKLEVENSITELLTSSQSEIKYYIENGIYDFSKILSKIKNDSLLDIKKSAQKNIDGFDIEIHLPDSSQIVLDTSIGGILNDVFEAKTKKVTKNRRKSGVWGTFCKWLNTDDWGWESYEATEKYYEVDLNLIAIAADGAVKNLFEAANEILDNEIYPQLHEGVNIFFKAFREKIEHIRGI